MTAIQLSPAIRLKNVYPALLDAIADTVSYEYMQLGLELGFSVKEILTFRRNHRTNTLEIVRQMLREWSERNESESKATIGWLATALLNARGDIQTLLELEDMDESSASETESTPVTSPGSKRCAIQ